MHQSIHKVIQIQGHPNSQEKPENPEQDKWLFRKGNHKD